MDGQSILSTVAIQTPLNSCLGEISGCALTAVVDPNNEHIERIPERKEKAGLLNFILKISITPGRCVAVKVLVRMIDEFECIDPHQNDQIAEKQGAENEAHESK